MYGEYMNQYVKKQGQILSSWKYKGKKGNTVPVDATEMCRGVEVYLPSLLTFTLYMGERSMLYTDHFMPWKRILLPTE